MSVIENLAKDNKDNYELYLKRMTESMKYSTKGFIPFFANNSKCALDVGCGSGVMLNALLNYGVEKVIGIDINNEAVERLKSLNNPKIEVYNVPFEDIDKLNLNVDTILFSSVLHEFSSYSETDRYSYNPIRDAIKKSYEILPVDGKIIIRDCIMADYYDRNKKVIISFNNKEDSKWLYRFKDEFKGFNNLDVNMDIEKESDEYKISLAFLKEFLYTYTWGEGSWNREINERTGIMDITSWEKMVEDNGFVIESVLYSKEEYEKYLSPKVNIRYEDGSPFIYPYMNITIVGVKKNML